VQAASQLLTSADL